MYLYDNGDNGKVLIYEMNKGNKLELVDYRLNKLINQNNKVFRFLTNEKVPPFDFDEASKRVVSDFLYDDIFYEKKAFLSSTYHLL